MKRSFLLCATLLAGALYSGGTAICTQVRYCAEWYRTAGADREALILGAYAPAVSKVRARVPETEGILLVTDMDPAPLPYALFPRRIWQVRTEPETSAVFMELPPSPYPVRPPETFPARWRLDLREANAETGGELTRLKTAGGER